MGVADSEGVRESADEPPTREGSAAFGDQEVLMVQEVLVVCEHTDIERIRSEQLRAEAHCAEAAGARWTAWSVTIDGQAADLVEVGESRVWLAHGDIVVEDHALPTETPERAVWRLLGEHAMAEAEREVWCGLYSRCLATCDSPMSSARADDALEELRQRGLVETMRRVMMR